MELSARQSSLRPSVGLPSLEEALGRDHHRHNNNNNNNSSHLAQQQQQQQPPRSLGHISSLSLPGLISDNSHLHGLHHSPGTSPDSTLQDEGHPHLSPPRGNNQRLDLDPGLIPHCLASSTGSGNNSSFYIQNSMNTPSSVGNAMALVGASQSGGMHGDGGLGLGSHGAPQSPMYNPAMWASNMGPSSAIARALSMTQQQQRRPRSEKKPIPEELKDGKYFERRKRNNHAAKKSRDARKAREDEIAIRASFLEKENAILRAQVATLREEANSLRQLLLQKRSRP